MDFGPDISDDEKKVLGEAKLDRRTFEGLVDPVDNSPNSSFKDEDFASERGGSDCVFLAFEDGIKVEAFATNCAHDSVILRA